jgi:hypothetical protein
MENEITEITEVNNLPAVTAGPLSMAMQAMKAGMSIADMKGLLELQKDWEANEARKAYVADMAEFKKNPPDIFKRKQVNFTTRDGDITSYQHATIGDVTSLTVEGLAKHGFSHRWDPKQQDGKVVVTCILTHRMGHSESTTLEAAPDASGKKNSIQQMASSVTYLERYTLLAAAGLATKDMEDDDGLAASDRYDAEGVLHEWTDKANLAQNLMALNDTRKMAGVEFNAAKDVAGWNAFKLAVEEKRKQLTEQAK